jgi:hypothetical protein
MKFKRKEHPKYIYRNEFLIFPRKFENFRYWLCWATIKYSRFGDKYSRHYTKFGTMVATGKLAHVFNDQFKHGVSTP